MFGGNFAPRGWAFCNGQLLAIASNQALFSILGTTYGGDGRTTFALPDLRGRVPVNSGNNSAGPGLQPVRLGEVGGSTSVTLSTLQMPQHTHAAVFTPPTVSASVAVADVGATATAPGGNIPAQSQQPGRTPVPVSSYAAPGDATGTLAGVTASATGGSVAVGSAGGSQPVDIQPPFLGVNFIIATQGIFPSRN